jgi:hypothetical protein
MGHPFNLRGQDNDRSSSHGREPKAATPSSDEHSEDEGRSDGKADRMKKIAAAIDETYDAMRFLVTRQAGKPGLREALHPLREKLRSLQSREAKEISEQYDSRFLPAYEEAQSLIQQARQVLKKP